MTLQLFNFFHLNLAYSAIEEEDRERVVKQCYWPLLRLVEARPICTGIELSGFTLETILAIDPAWVEKFRALIERRRCELLGCGYAQVISPLCPPTLTRANLRIGQETYQRLLGRAPSIALLNEQAFSSGIIPLYEEAGYQAVIMEWNNPARGHPEWDSEWRYYPQRAIGANGRSMPLIWNKSIAFQKFQRYAHGEMELDEMLAYIRSHKGEQARSLALYGNDAEIFDFRPGRYMTEAPLQSHSEWARIEELYVALLSDDSVKLVSPGDLLSVTDQECAGHELRLETPAQPVPVKKQNKYNLVRWAVSGRDDLRINTRCWRIFSAMEHSEDVAEEDWKDLCFLWSSDFRTHITEKRWQRYVDRLRAVEARWCLPKSSADTKVGDSFEGCRSGVGAQGAKSVRAGDDSREMRSGRVMDQDARWHRKGRFLEFRGQRLSLRFNCLRGLALDAFVDGEISERPLFGTLHHGHFDDIHWGADYYSGHLVFESPGRHKVTDLAPVEPEILNAETSVEVRCQVNTPLGVVRKVWCIDDAKGCVCLTYCLDWRESVVGSLRLGHVTLIPEAFTRDTLVYRAHNGGEALESFMLHGHEVDHGRPVSFLVSASQALGLTGGVAEMGDSVKGVRVRFRKSEAALIGLVTHREIDDTHFTRLSLSARELDDTSRPAPVGSLALTIEYSGVLWR